MGKLYRKAVGGGSSDETELMLDRFERLLRKKNVPEVKTRTYERLVLRSKLYAEIASSAFQTKELLRALALLTRAINILPSPALFAKRSVVHLAMGNYKLAAADGTCAIGLDRTFPSGYFCRALALIHLGEFEIALNELDKLRQCLPNSRTCNQLYVRCRNQFWDKGEMEPFEIPRNIIDDSVNEEGSVFLERRINELRAELSISGIIEASKFTEEFVMRVIETYKQGIFHLPLKHVFMVMQHALQFLKDHENVVSIDITVHQKLTVVGDLRGNFHNLMSIFNRNQSPQFGRPYLFNGNIIGDYRMSLPCIVIILCMKILFPEDVFINRGSEECLERCEANGFENEVLTVYDEEVMKGFTEVFNWLPVAHVLNNSVLIVHGGIFGNKNITLADIQEIKRCFQPPDAGPMCDILYSDPWNYCGISKADRQRGVWFGPDATNQFCRRNCLDYIVRSHQTPNALGYDVQTYSQCITVNSSTQHATYLKISGETSVHQVVHSRKDKKIPKDCSCWITCSCLTTKEKQPLHDYATMKLDLLPAPSETNSKNIHDLTSSQSLLQSIKSENSQSKPVNESCKSVSYIVSGISHDLSQMSIHNIRKAVRSKISLNLSGATESPSTASVKISEQSNKTTRSNRLPFPTTSPESDIDSDSEESDTNPTFIDRSERTPTITTDTFTIDEPYQDVTIDHEEAEVHETGSEMFSVRTGDISPGSHQDSPKDDDPVKEDMANQLLNRSNTRSFHWLAGDQLNPTHSEDNMEELEDGTEQSDQEK